MPSRSVAEPCAAGARPAIETPIPQRSPPLKSAQTPPPGVLAARTGGPGAVLARGLSEPRQAAPAGAHQAVEERGMMPPSVSAIGRIIKADPDKMRCAPLRLDARGRRKPLRQTRKTRRPKEQTTAPLVLFACAAEAKWALDELTPVPIRYVLSDNGSKFIKDFKAELQRRISLIGSPARSRRR